MHHFRYADGELHAEQVPVRRIVAAVGTPVYVYSARTIRHHYERVRESFAPVGGRIHFAVKACSNLAVLALLRELGAGFDVVSAGEVERCLRIGAAPSGIVFAGVGKTEEELAFALERGVGLFNVESRHELAVLAAVAARLGRSARVALRLNPDVDAGTHAYITTGCGHNKFGMLPEVARRALDDLRELPQLELLGFHVHVGSQIREPGPFVAAARRIADFVAETRGAGHEVRLVNLGGGFAADYQESAPLVSEVAAAVLPTLETLGVEVLLEPGRVIVANAGLLVTRITHVKSGADREFLVTDAGMNDLLRPALYQAWHPIRPVREAPAGAPCRLVDVVGPVCESGDFLGLDRELPALEAGDLLAVFGAGAYGHVMASNYNSRLRPPEVLVEGDAMRIVRRRETIDDLLGPELDPGA